jgi:hypothetical protein
MNTINRWVEKIFKFFASLKLAIMIMLSLGVITAVGTIVESMYDARYAQKTVYFSPIMYFILALLCVNLINVMVDRWPWKKHHVGFISAHVGIITVIIGSLITYLYGIDGSLYLEPGKTGRYVSLPDQEIAVYATMGEGQYRVVNQKEVDFITRPLKGESKIFSIDGQDIMLKQAIHYGLREQKVIRSQSQSAGPAVRIQLSNPNINMTKWLLLSSYHPESKVQLGPAELVLLAKDQKFNWAGQNAVVMKVLSSPKSDDLKVDYEVWTKSKGGKTKSGTTKLGETVAVGWMNIELRLLNVYDRAEEKVTFTKRDRPTGKTESAIEVSWLGQTHWIGLNSSVRFFTNNAAYWVTYRNKSYDLGFDVRLDHFEVGQYAGTKRAMSYESHVEIPAKDVKARIFMNNPLELDGFTYYQASFQEDEMGKPTASILSVNRDPGLALKYLGCLLITFGTLMMFYFKNYRMKIGSYFKRDVSQDEK